MDINPISNLVAIILTEDSEDEDEIQFFQTLTNTVMWPSDPTVRIHNYSEVIIPLYSDCDFKEHFRMTRATFSILLDEIGPLLHNATGRPMIDPTKQILCTLWVLANPDSFRSIADRFDLPKSSVWHCVVRTCKALTSLAGKIIQMPTGDEINQVIEGFETKAGFPGVIGAIDGTHIIIKAPKQVPQRYINRKKHYSIVLQAICDSDMMFMDCYCGMPGSVHDARVFRNSPICGTLASGTYGVDQHLIGDGGYKLLNNLIIPYRNNGHLSHQQLRFNKKLSQTRIIIEQAFGLLKQRFRRLKCIEFAKTEMVPLYILSCCVLHNFCLKNDDILDWLEADEDIDASNVDPFPTNGNDVSITKRNTLCQLLQ